MSCSQRTRRPAGTLAGLCASLFMLDTLVEPAFAAETTPADRAEALTLLERALDVGEEVRSGVVHIERVEVRSGEQDRSTEFLAFDRDRDIHRFDYETQWHGRLLSGKIAAGPDETLTAQSGGGFPGPAVRHPAGYKPRSGTGKPLDLRVLPFASVSIFNYTPDQWRDTFLPIFAGADVTRFDRVGMIVHVEWSIAPSVPEAPPARARVRFDTEQGSLPVQWHVANHLESGEWDVSYTTLIRYEEHDGVWVPTHWESESPGSVFSRHVIDLDWESVNERISDDLFAMEKLELNPATLVFNKKLGEPVFEGPAVEVIAEAEEARTLARGRWLWPLVAVNAVLAVGLLVVYLRRHAAG